MTCDDRGHVKAFTLDEVPQASGFRQYIQDLYVKVTAASKRFRNRTMRWIQLVEKLSLAELEVPSKPWDDLDTAIAEAVICVAKRPIARELLLYREENRAPARLWQAAHLCGISTNVLNMIWHCIIN